MGFNPTLLEVGAEDGEGSRPIDSCGSLSIFLMKELELFVGEGMDGTGVCAWLVQARGRKMQH